MISKLAQNISISPTLEIFQQVSQQRAAGKTLIDFGVGETDFNTPEHIKSAAIKAIQSNHTRYTSNEGTPELRQIVSTFLKNEYHLEYSSDEIIISNGAKQSVFLALGVCINPGDEVLIPAPYYPSYIEMVKLLHGIPKIIPTEEFHSFKLQPDILLTYLSEKTKVLILNHPANPTGIAYKQEELHSLAQILEPLDLTIISDEIYSQLLSPGFTFHSFATTSPAIKEKSIIISGVSKSFAMTGWRIGIAAAPRQYIQAMNKIQNHTTGHPSSISQKAAVSAYSQSLTSTKTMEESLQGRQNIMRKALLSIENISWVEPDGGFYFYVNISSYLNKKTGQNKLISSSKEFALYLLLEYNVVVIPGEAFGTENYLRISYSKTSDCIEDGIHKLKTALLSLT